MPPDNLPIPLVLYYPFLAFVLLGIALAVIPRPDIKRLFPESLGWGFLLSFVFVVVCGRLLGLFQYRHAGPFVILDVPVWLALAWSPTIMIYLHFMPEMRKFVRFIVYLVSFSLLSTFLDAGFNRLGLLEYCHWSHVARFFVAMGWFYATAWVHEKHMDA